MPEEWTLRDASEKKRKADENHGCGPGRPRRAEENNNQRLVEGEEGGGGGGEDVEESGGEVNILWRAALKRGLSRGGGSCQWTCLCGVRQSHWGARNSDM